MKARISLVLVSLVYFCGTTSGQSPGDILVTPESGTWLVCVTCYVGEKAPELARSLITEIRSRHKLPAYAINKGGDEKRKQREEIDKRKAAFFAQFPDANVPVRVRMTRVEEEYAVVIGGFKTLDQAQKAMKDIRKLPPPSDENLCPLLTRVRANDDPNGPQGVIEGARINPFGMAFAVRNPTVPPEQKADAKNDPLLTRLNSGEKYSLLKNKKPWTLAVANYVGLQTIQGKGDSGASFWEKFWDNQSGEVLEASAHNARNLVDALRKMGLEAYVLHTRHSSVVTVGSFDTLEDPRIEQTKATVARLQADRTGVMLPKPMAMEVPRP